MEKHLQSLQCFDSMSYSVTVVIPCFNSANTIGRTLRSIVQQEQLPTRIIIIDDNSSDGTTDFIRQTFPEQCNSGFIRLYVLESNFGPSAARQRGIELTTTPYVTFVDADDCYLSKDVFSQIYPILKQHSPDFLMFKYKTQHGNVTLSKNYQVLSEGLHTSREAMIAKVNYPDPPIWHYVWNKVYKTSIIKGNNIYFDAKMSSSEDVAFNDDFLAVSNNIYFLNNFLYLYDCTSYYSLTRQIASKNDATNSYEQVLKSYKRELQRYNKMVTISERLSCQTECIAKLRKDFCLYLYKLERSSRRCDYHTELMHTVRQFNDYSEIAKYLSEVKRNYIIGKAKSELRSIIKSMLKHLLS